MDGLTLCKTKATREPKAIPLIQSYLLPDARFETQELIPKQNCTESKLFQKDHMRSGVAVLGVVLFPVVIKLVFREEVEKPQGAGAVPYRSSNL
jgi:hypothetical protein